MKEREMTWIGLGNPTPAPAVLPYRSFDWRNGDRVFLPIENFVLQGSLSDVLNSRRTARTFGPIESKDLSAILWLTCRIQQTLSSELGFPPTPPPVPSAGAIHPIHVLILERSVAAWQRYDPLQHSLVTVYGSESFADASRKAASEVLEIQQGLIIGLAAEPGKVAAKYQESASLVWRDAGVLLGYLSIVSEALNLNFCPLGITGDPSISNLDEESRLAGVGLAILGSHNPA